MKIFATFANRSYDHDAIELIDAWDEFCVDENPQGFDDSRRKAIASWGSDLLRWVTVEIKVDDAQIYEALDPAVVVNGEITHVFEASA